MQRPVSSINQAQDHSTAFGEQFYDGVKKSKDVTIFAFLFIRERVSGCFMLDY